PSSAVDDALRAQARRAVGARPRASRSPFGSSWRVPVSIAAVVIVSATLTVLVTREARHLPAADQVGAGKTAPPTAPSEEQTPAQPLKPQAGMMNNAPAKNAELPAVEQQTRKKSQASRADAANAPARPGTRDESARHNLEEPAQPFPAT